MKQKNKNAPPQGYQLNMLQEDLIRLGISPHIKAAQGQLVRRKDLLTKRNREKKDIPFPLLEVPLEHQVNQQ